MKTWRDLEVVLAEARAKGDPVQMAGPQPGHALPKRQPWHARGAICLALLVRWSTWAACWVTLVI